MISIVLFLLLAAVLVEVMVVPNVMDYTSILAKVGGCGSSTHTPWYARKDVEYDLTNLGEALAAIVTLEYTPAATATRAKATVTFDLQPVLTMVGKDKFKEEDVIGGTLVDGKKVQVTVTSNAEKAVDATATVKLAHSTLLLTVTGTIDFAVTAAVPADTSTGTAGSPAALTVTTPTAVIEYFVDLKLGESGNMVPIM
jgi:hypothetical protein